MTQSDTNYARGIRAEGAAKSYLEEDGYEILHERYKSKFGEIDIIAIKDRVLCFVEVKMRKTVHEALESVTAKSQKRIENTALLFLSNNPDYTNYNMRFDVVAISYSNDDKLSITHLDNAWEARS
ncbi:MAG: YraN family protein [Alphaproteobacteria bacterium]